MCALSASSDPSAFFEEPCPHLQFPSPPSSAASWDQPGGAPGQDLGHSRGHLWPCSLWVDQELRVLGAPQRVRASPSGHSRTRTGPPVTKCLGQGHREPRYRSCAQGACRLVRKTRTKRGRSERAGALRPLIRAPVRPIITDTSCSGGCRDEAATPPWAHDSDACRVL